MEEYQESNSTSTAPCEGATAQGVLSEPRKVPVAQSLDVSAVVALQQEVKDLKAMLALSRSEMLMMKEQIQSLSGILMQVTGSGTLPNDARRSE